MSTDTPLTDRPALSLRADVAMLTLQLRSALHEANAAEANERTADIAAAREKLRARLAPLMEDRLGAFERELADARDEAAAAIAAARRTAQGMVGPSGASGSMIATSAPTARPTLPLSTELMPPRTPLIASAAPIAAPPAPAVAPTLLSAPPLPSVVVAEPQPSPAVDDPEPASPPTVEAAERPVLPAPEASSPFPPPQLPPSVTMPAPPPASFETIPRLASSEPIPPLVEMLQWFPDTAASAVEAVEAAEPTFRPPAFPDVVGAADVAGVANVMIDAQAFAQAFALAFAAATEGRPLAWGGALPATVAEGPQAPKQSFWTHARHPDVLLIGLATVIVLIIVAAWLA